MNKAAKSQAKAYRERHQPQDRDHLGMLEKKKDYKLRAKDYNDKKEVLKHLRKKALNKNPDEFYFHMSNAKIVDGAHRDLVSKKGKKTTAAAHTQDQLRLMQTQDHKYIAMRRLMEQRKIEKLKATLHLLDSRPATNTHTLFVNDETEKKSLDLAAHFDTAPEMLARPSHRPYLETLKSNDLDFSSSQVRSEKGYKQLSQRIAREKQLAIVEEKMNVRRALSGKKGQQQSATILKEETAHSAPVLKWRRERKR